MANDVNFSQVSNTQHTTGVLLEMFPFLGVSVLDPRFYYNTFLVSNKMVG